MKVAVCFCGFNRDSYLKINLKKILNDYIFNNRLTTIDAYYHTYSSKYEDTNNPIDVENIKTSFQDNGIDNLYLIHEEYNLTYFLRKIKESITLIKHNFGICLSMIEMKYEEFGLTQKSKFKTELFLKIMPMIKKVKLGILKKEILLGKIIYPN